MSVRFKNGVLQIGGRHVEPIDESQIERVFVDCPACKRRLDLQKNHDDGYYRCPECSEEFFMDERMRTYQASN